MTPQLAIHTSGLRKAFDDVEALKGLDLDVARGEMFGLVGPDGAGKTTAIRTLCGILIQDAGTAEVLGFNLPEQRIRLRDHIGYLSQRFSLYEDLSIDENIAFFAEIHQVKDYRARRDELLAFTRLTPFRDRLAGRLSGGMRQKLALACTLIHRPSLILLDEPTTGVDPVARRDFWKLLADIRQTGVTILMSTPYLDEAERCTHIGLLDRGRLLVTGTPDQVRNMLEGFVVEVVCEGIRDVVHHLTAHPEVIDVQLFGDRLNAVLHTDTESDALALVRTWMEAEGVPVRSIRPVPPSLENAFITLLNREHANEAP